MNKKTLFTLKTAAQWCGGEYTGDDVDVCSVIIDSRDAVKDEKMMFVALEGENTDGHRFIKSALENGANCVLCKQAPVDSNAIIVKDTLRALGDIAENYKKQKKVFTVGITGSVGKTTTKELTASVFSKKYKTYKTDGNYNSVIGLPLTVFKMPDDCTASVLEMGMSARGEISAMARVARPDTAIITNIGTSHLEMLKTRENILRAKLEITDYFDEGCTLVMNGDDPFLWEYRNEHTEFRKIYAGINNGSADFRALNVVNESTKMRFDVYVKAEDRIVSDVVIPAVGIHNVLNAVCVFACAYNAGIDENSIKEGFLDYKTTGMRQKIYGVGEYTFVADCYNASPESMKASSLMLSQMAKEKNVRSHAVLGEMRELGDTAHQLHMDVGRAMYENGVDFLYLWGSNACAIGKGAIEAGMPKENVFMFESGGEYSLLSKTVRANLKKGDTVLFKASRYVRLEEAIENLEGYLKNI